MNRSAFDIGKPGSHSYKINTLFKAKYGRDLDDTSARWMQGFLVLVDAINRAGSTDAAKIQQALQETDLKPDALMIGYRGVKFDATGQNTLSATYLIQLQGKEYKSVWPSDRATAQLEWPMKGWRKKRGGAPGPPAPARPPLVWRGRCRASPSPSRSRARRSPRSRRAW